MCKARKLRKLRPCAKSLIHSMRQFLTPAVFKQVRNGTHRRKMPRWDVHPLIHVAIVMTWCCGDSLPERFEAARGVLCRFLWEAQASRDLGAGIRAGAAKTPHARVAQLGSSDSPPRANAFRRPTAGGRIYSLRLRRHAQESPRSEELERRLGTFGKEGSAP